MRLVMGSAFLFARAHPIKGALLPELKTEIKQLLKVEETIRALRQKKESELRRQLIKSELNTNGSKLSPGSSAKV
jgi:hypothetical protein